MFVATKIFSVPFVVGSMLLMASLRQRGGRVAAFSTTASKSFVKRDIQRNGGKAGGKFRKGSIASIFGQYQYRSQHGMYLPSTLQMSTMTSDPPTGILPRIKTVDATKPTDGPVLIKGWVRTIRKQKTLAFVEVNDGSNMSGIQCVLSFDSIDEDSKAGEK
jgi:hypothetical protein